MPIRNRAELVESLANLRPNRKAILVGGEEEIAIAKELEAEGLADYKPAPLWEGHQAGYLFPARGR